MIGTTPIKRLLDQGQSVWLDSIRRHLITSGDLHRMVEVEGVRGVTSNPAIFEKAIAGSSDYTNALAALLRHGHVDAKSVYETLAVRDLEDAADILRPVFESTGREDGYVSLEVSPHLADDTEATVEEAKRLWAAVARDNLMIKVPATPAGIPAIRQLIARGINVNVTLLFSVETYAQVAEAYLSGLEDHRRRGGDLGRLASVASFFLSRIDSAVDTLLDERLSKPSKGACAPRVHGKAAIASAKLAYQRYTSIHSGERWSALAAQGARPQRLLWASTGTKNPSYSDVLYVEELIGPDTVTTLPPATFEAFRDHGKVRPTLEEDLDAARDTLATIESLGISMSELTAGLLADGVRLFQQAFDKLLAAIDDRCQGRKQAERDRMSVQLPAELAAGVRDSLSDWRVSAKVRRLWARDPSVWTSSDEGSWLGWLSITEDQLAHIHHLEALAAEVRSRGFTHALLLGMGGSSLCPAVLRATFGTIAGHPELWVLDSTDPAQVLTFESRVDIERTLFIVSSKSGTTLEPNAFMQYFFERVSDRLGAKEAGSRFVAITDPGSKLERVARERLFARVFHGLESIGGRYSALSNFGMVPAAIMGLDTARLLDRAENMVQACASCVPAEDNPGVLLGTVLGVLGKRGRDKVTIIASPAISELGAWLEQLLAESTGKKGKGLIPVDREPLGPPAVYGEDRVFIYLRSEEAPEAAQDAGIEALERAGQPVVRIPVADRYDLGQEFFRWEMATAVAGSILGLNPFDQPDVEASKVATRRLTQSVEETGALPAETPFAVRDGYALFADDWNAGEIRRAAGEDETLAGILGAHLGRLGEGDYVALLAYVEMNEAHETELTAMRRAVRDRTGVATCVGFGPRFLHSTGQAYKGGPGSGVFLQITTEDAAEIMVPGQRYTFGMVKAAQARGDFEVLAERKRRALRVHLDREGGLAGLRAAFEEALA